MGVPLPVDFSEPCILPAFVVETLIGLFFAFSAFALFTSKNWAWAATLGAHVFCIAGLLLGIVATTFWAGPEHGGERALSPSIAGSGRHC